MTAHNAGILPRCRAYLAYR